MCLSKAYIDHNGDTELLMEEVSSITTDDGKLWLKSLLGEQREIEATVKKIDFMTHAIFLENMKQE